MTDHTSVDTSSNEPEQARRWRLLLGEAADDSCGAPASTSVDFQIDKALTALYDQNSEHHLRKGRGS